jgi:ketosteroid isomerase-like protein
MQIQRSDITEIEEKLLKAIQSSNINFLENILHNDLLFLLPSGEILTKEMDLHSHRSGEMIVERIVPTLEELKIFEDTAIVIIVYETKGKMLGNPIEGKFRYLRIWKNFPDGLKVIAGSCVQI